MVKEEKTLTRTCPIKISRVESPVDNWNDFDKIFDIIQKETVLASNRVISVCNAYSAMNKDQTWLENTYNQTKIDNTLYAIARENCKYQYSGGANMISHNISKNYFKGMNSWEKKARKGEGNPPMSFSASTPINIRSDCTQVEIVDTDRGYFKFTMSFLGMNAAKGVPITTTIYVDGKQKKQKRMIPIDKRQIVFYVAARSSSYLWKILNNIANGTYKIGDSSIARKRRKKKQSKNPGEGKYEYTFLMAYTYPVSQDIQLDKSRVVGVDVGVNIPLTCSTNYDSSIFWPIGDRKIFDQTMRDKKWVSKKKKAIKYNGRDGHGRKYKLDGTNNSNTRIANRQNTYNRTLASALIKKCKRENIGTIQIEDLTGMSESEVSNSFLRNWPYYGMQQAIIQAAEKIGIDVWYVNRYQTSQECPVCHCIDKANRPKGDKGQRYFKCISCGYEDNADHVAAINIAHRDPSKCKKNKL